MNAQLRLDLAEDRAVAGMTRAVEHADRTTDGWRFQALSLLVAYAHEVRKPFLVEDARRWAEARGLEPPPDGRAYGAVVRMAARRVLKQAGYGPAASSNGSPKVLWELAHEPAQMELPA